MGQRELSELVWWASYSLGTPTLCPHICSDEQGKAVTELPGCLQPEFLLAWT